MIASISFAGSGSLTANAAPVTERLSAARQAALIDAALVQRFHGGDESAFVEIITRYQAKMFSIAFSFLRNRADAEEVAQDTFIRAHRALAGFRGESALATWLHRITLNLSRNRYWHLFRRHYHTNRSLDCALGDDTTATLASLVASEAPNPREEAQTGEFAVLVSRCMERLSPARRDMLTRRNLQNCSYDEIALTLGISIGTVKSRIARARDALRQELVKACPDLAEDASPTAWLCPARNTSGLDYGRA